MEAPAGSDCSTTGPYRDSVHKTYPSNAMWAALAFGGVPTFKALMYFQNHLSRYNPVRALHSADQNWLVVPGLRDVWLSLMRARAFWWNSLSNNICRFHALWDLLMFCRACKAKMLYEAFTWEQHRFQHGTPIPDLPWNSSAARIYCVICSYLCVQQFLWDFNSVFIVLLYVALGMDCQGGDWSINQKDGQTNK